MIIEPKVRGFICLTAHPKGCEKNVVNQIEYIKSKGKINGAPSKVLIIGASTGFGLASRITSAFGANASTIGVFFEKEPRSGKTGSPGWYNSAAFEKKANEAQLYATSINGDAFSNEIKDETIKLIKQDLGQVDLVIYSLASPKRKDPNSEEVFNSVLKPINNQYSSRTVNFHTGEISEISIDPCTEDEIDNTIKVMGGEDWELWIDALKEANTLSSKALTVAYSYVGPDLTDPIYRKGTIGRAKDHLEATAFRINEKLEDISGKAYVSVNKALVTQASSAIPVIPLYMSILFKIMKESNVHEGCIEQIQRLFQDHLYSKDLQLDDSGRIRIDDLEMREDIQSKVTKIWSQVTDENIDEITDLEGYREDFFNLFGFKIDGIDYNADVNELETVPSLSKQNVMN